MTENIITDAMDKLRGAVAIVFPMNLPPYDIIRQEFEGSEDLAGTQVYSSKCESSSCTAVGHWKPPPPNLITPPLNA